MDCEQRGSSCTKLVDPRRAHVADGSRLRGLLRPKQQPAHRDVNHLGSRARKQAVDFGFGVSQALVGKRDELGHFWVDVGERELDADEAGLKSGERDAMGQPALDMVPAVTRPTLAITTASGDHHVERGAQKALHGVVIKGHSRNHEVIDPGLHCGRCTVVVERRTQDDGVGLVDLPGQLKPERIDLRLVRGVVVRGVWNTMLVRCGIGSVPKSRYVTVLSGFAAFQAAAARAVRRRVTESSPRRLESI
jgi:hypothetical protein